jgi:hypothetical protein
MAYWTGLCDKVGTVGKVGKVGKVSKVSTTLPETEWAL